MHLDHDQKLMYQFERNMRFSSTYLNTFSKGKEPEQATCPERSKKKNG